MWQNILFTSYHWYFCKEFFLSPYFSISWDKFEIFHNKLIATGLLWQTGDKNILSREVSAQIVKLMPYNLKGRCSRLGRDNLQTFFAYMLSTLAKHRIIFLVQIQQSVASQPMSLLHCRSPYISIRGGIQKWRKQKFPLASPSVSSKRRKSFVANFIALFISTSMPAG